MSEYQSIELNGRRYARPRKATVVVCVDGCDPEYIEHGIESGLLPTVAAWQESGFIGLADAAMPTFTNPNNMSIVTGALPEIHGISGNYHLDRATGEAVMVTDAGLLRSETVLGKLSSIGVKTAVVTAKDKLRRLLGHKMQGICFSAECADRCTKEEHGIEAVEAFVGRPLPERYSGDLSLFVLDAGIRLLETGQAELLYLSLSDYIQHRHEPGSPASDSFHGALDARLARLVGSGAVVAVTADHGMSDKSLPDGEPKVVYLEDRINARLGAGAVRVICPITDPFVRHHGSLGSFARVYVQDPGISSEAVIEFLGRVEGIELALKQNEACARFGLPEDCEGDIAVVGDSGTVLGARVEDHDLSALEGHRLRSHGGLSEQRVPFMLSRPLTQSYRAKSETMALRNYDIFDFALNGLTAGD